MTAFVILAAGPGTRVSRVGGGLHKALLPLDGRAVISHQLELRPTSSRVIVCVGSQAEQVRSYVRLAHPDLDVTFVDVLDWNNPGGGPGATLLVAREVIGEDDFMFTSCDTLWDWNDLWQLDVHLNRTWLGVAPIPPGTPLGRWCRVVAGLNDRVEAIIDKEPGADGEDSLAYVGLAHVAGDDAPTFWQNLELSGTVHGELQVSGGFYLLRNQGKVYAQHITWTDVGDEQAYRTAVATRSGYDWTKAGQATYVLPSTSRVVKYHSDPNVLQRRAERGITLHKHGVVSNVHPDRELLAVDYVPGLTVYDYIDQRCPINLERHRVLERLVAWLESTIDADVPIERDEMLARSFKFYAHKTYERVGLLTPDLRRVALDSVTCVDWNVLAIFCAPTSVWHGDLNFGNIIMSKTGGEFEFTGIDWREDFAGTTQWGDLRYDVAKLLAGCVVHWGRARRGDFTPWKEGEALADQLRSWRLYTPECEVIAALSLLNSAPLHAPPLDEVLVARACEWLNKCVRQFW